MAVAWAMAAVRARSRAFTDHRLVCFSVESVVADLNRSLRSGAVYFRYGNCGRKFTIIDSYVHERLAIFASTKHGLSGRNWERRFTTAWPGSLGSPRPIHTEPAPCLVHPRPACGSRMTGDCHVRFCKSRAVRFRPATYLKGGWGNVLAGRAARP